MQQTDDVQQTDESRPFAPKGAIAFFILLILLCGIIWFGIYFIMLQRA
jgi:hypothetical protein